jgi:CRISPR/Cas system-associated endonuclease/helicase Cas3
MLRNWQSHIRKTSKEMEWKMSRATVKKAHRLIEQMKATYQSPLMDSNFTMLSGSEVKKDMTRMIATVENLMSELDKTKNPLWEGE